MSAPSVLFASGNPGKVAEARKALADTHLDFLSLTDLGLDLDVEETGRTLEDNALLKARAARAIAPKDLYVLADDTGLEIPALNNEPGPRVRRWRNPQVESPPDEVLDEVLRRTRHLKGEERRARFTTAIAMITPDGAEMSMRGQLAGLLLGEPVDALGHPGQPISRIFFVEPWGKTLAEAHETATGPLITHRSLALIAAAQNLRSAAGTLWDD